MTATVTSLGVTTLPLRSTTTPSSGGGSLTPVSTRPMSTPPWPVTAWSRDKNTKKYHYNKYKTILIHAAFMSVKFNYF